MKKVAKKNKFSKLRLKVYFDSPTLQIINFQFLTIYEI